MKAERLRMTAHAWRRLAQRNLTLSDVLVALRHGRRVHRAHADFWFLAGRDLPRGQERLEGLTVVVEEDFISTVYRNKRALAKLKRKPKRNNGRWERKAYA